MSYVDRYTTMMAAKGRSFARMNGQLFVRKSQWITPVGPAAQRFVLAKSEARNLLKDLGGWWISWTGGFGGDSGGTEWYAVICQKFRPVEAFPAKRRYEVNRGLKNCDVRRVSAAEIAQNAYDVHVAAVKGYAGGQAVSLPKPAEFSSRVLSDAPFDDIKHHWAVYHEGRMVAFAQCYLYDRIEVDYTLIKLHPEYRSLYAGYALIQRMNEFYLREQGFQYVNDGWRSILHDTNMQDFLLGKFNFEKAPARLHLQFRQPLAQFLSICGPTLSVFERRNPRLAAILQMKRLSSVPASSLG